MQHAAPIQTKIINLPYRVYDANGMMVGQYETMKKAKGNTAHIPDVVIRYEP